MDTNTSNRRRHNKPLTNPALRLAVARLVLEQVPSALQSARGRKAANKQHGNVGAFSLAALAVAENQRVLMNAQDVLAKHS